MSERKNPTIDPTVIDDGEGQIVTRHPAFGLVSVNRTHTTGARLYASDLNHQEVISLAFYEAEQLENDGTIRHRLSGARRRAPLLEVSLSPAQWATMITSFGMGDGVPCTLEGVTRGAYERLPYIGKAETPRERYERQIKESAETQIRKFAEKVEKLGALAAKGKAGKKELTEIYSEMTSVLNNLPGNLAFSTELMQESMDKIIANGKAELEATAIGVATRLGVKSIAQLAALEDKSKEGDEK